MAAPLDQRGLPPVLRWRRASANERACETCKGKGHRDGYPQWQCQHCRGWGVEFGTGTL